VLGGTELTDEDLVYGPARYLRPAEVRATAQALQPISFDELWSRLDEARIREAELYWETRSESEAYVREYYQAPWIPDELATLPNAPASCQIRTIGLW
jgi:hypothetical protein